jgi:hypothetical protein
VKISDVIGQKTNEWKKYQNWAAFVKAAITAQADLGPG